MFSKSITNSSNFLMMPQSSQNLYFHLGMNADDDGFCEHFTIMRMTESKPDDLKILQVKGFVSIFDDRVLVILDWKENNLIQKDRYHSSKYLELYKKEIALLSENTKDATKMLPECYQDGSKVLPQVRLGKVSIGKDSEVITGVFDSQKTPSINSLTSNLEEKTNHSAYRRDVAIEDVEEKSTFQEIQDHWNTKEIIVHGKLSPFVEKYTRKLFKEGITVEEIKRAIDNYADVLFDSRTLMKYKWSLDQFLQREGGCRYYKDKTLEDSIPTQR